MTQSYNQFKPNESCDFFCKRTWLFPTDTEHFCNWNGLFLQMTHFFLWFREQQSSANHFWIIQALIQRTSLTASMTSRRALESAERLTLSLVRLQSFGRPVGIHFLRRGFQIKKSLRHRTARLAEMKEWPRHTCDRYEPAVARKSQMCEYWFHGASEDFFRSRIPSDAGGKNPTAEKPATLPANEIKRAVRFCMLMPAVGVDSI